MDRQEPAEPAAIPAPGAGSYGGPGGKRLLSEPEAYTLLAGYGIPVPEFRVATSPEEAADHADAIGYPVVLKVISPQVVHKSDAGGVVTGLPDRASVTLAFLRIRERVARAVPGAAITGILVVKQLPAGLELLVGGITDRTFGKVLTLGLGGITVELDPDITMRILPVSDPEFGAMIGDLRGYPLLGGYRGRPPLDTGALVRLLSACARMFLSSDVAEFDLNPVLLYEKGCAIVDARVYTAPPAPAAGAPAPGFARELMRPGSIAVIGASSDPRKIGYAVLRNLLAFPGALYPVNPHSPEILGRRVYRTVAEIPGTVDCGVVAVPAPAVPGIIEEMGQKGIRLAVIVSSGFRETGPDGKAIEDRTVEAALKHGIRIVGPNSLGIMLPHQKINTTFDPVSPRPGHIAFLSQSGAIITTIVDWSLPAQVGFSAVISVGNQPDLGFTEYLEYAADDPETRAIAMYIEEIRDGPRFLAAVSAITAKKPVIALKSGSSKKGVAAASSHTGSLAGSYAVYQAAFRQAGVIPAYTLRELFDIAELLAAEGYPEGIRAVVITGAGGLAVLSSDYAERYGLDLIEIPPQMLADLNAVLPAAWSHRNPIDIIGDGGADRYAKVFDILLRHEDAWDIAFVIAMPSAVLDGAHLGQEIVRFSGHTKKMIVGCLIGGDSLKRGIHILRAHNIPNYGELEDAFSTVCRATGIAKRCR